MAYPVVFQADYREKQSRLLTFFRLLLAIPWYLVSIIWSLLAYIGVVIGWFALLFTGRYPEFAYKWVAQWLRFNTRLSGWFFLMTDEWPPFDGDDHPEYPVRAIIPPAQDQYERWKVLLRIILAIPVAIMAWIFTLLLELISFIVWVVVVFTGKTPRGLWDILKMCNAYLTRANAYMYLVTETYPPISADDDALPPSPSTTPPPAASPFGG